MIIDQRFHFAAVITADEGVANSQRSHLDDDGRGRTTTRLDLRFNDGAARFRRRRRFQLHHLGLQRHHFQKLVDIRSSGRGYRNRDCFAAPIFRR